MIAQSIFFNITMEIFCRFDNSYLELTLLNIENLKQKYSSCDLIIK